MSVFQAVLKQTDKLKEENLNVSRLSSGKSILHLNLSNEFLQERIPVDYPD